MIKGILFDYGGTLDTAALHWSYVIYEGYIQAKIKLSQDNFRDAYVYAEKALAKTRYILPTDDFFTLLHKKVNLEIEYLIANDMWIPTNYEERAKAINNIALYCDNFARNKVKESSTILKYLSKKYKMVMVSNFYGNLYTVLNNYGIAKYFEKIVESAIIGIRKPDPTIYKVGIETIGYKPEECIVIGDSFTKDIIPGQKNGCKTIWFKGKEWKDTDYDESIPSYIISSLKDILNIL